VFFTLLALDNSAETTMKTISKNPQTWLFWGLMILAQACAFLLFKDLADLSQWVLQSDREFTMNVWYLRHPLAVISILGLLSCVYIWQKNRSLLGIKLFLSLCLLCLFNWYSGFINPSLMFRSQQYDHQSIFVSVEDAPKYLQEMMHTSYLKPRYDSIDEINVIVLETDQGTQAYTDYYLMQPHIANGGTINGEEVVMTYCSLTNMGVAYSPIINNQHLDLSVMTQLRNNLVMADNNTGEPIQQMWGTLERDGEHGPAMKQWPTFRMPFGSFRKLYPEGKVYINGIKQASDNVFVQAFDYVIRDIIMVHAVRTLQWQSDKPAFPTIKEFDNRLPPKQLVYGINVNDDYVAYTKEFVAEQGGLMNVRIGEKPVVLYYDVQHDSLVAFYNNADSAVTTIDIFGNSNQGQLERVETMKSAIFWFIWYDFYKQTDVNRV
jgi:hypothetical protein